MTRATVRATVHTVVIFFFLLSYVVSFSETANITVVNRTRHYLHVVINNKPSLYVAPGATVQEDLGGLSAFVEVFYSPGQGIAGRGERELTATVTTRVNDSATCSNSKGTCDNSTSSTTSVSPLTWSVTPTDLSSN